MPITEMNKKKNLEFTTVFRGKAEGSEKSGKRFLIRNGLRIKV